ncbi:hypothetical protein KR044_008710, partial [Drosophila immigrans]
MAGTFSILLTLVVHLIWGTSIFIHQVGEISKEAPLIASILVYLSLVCLFFSVELIPPHWSHMPALFKFLIEFFLIVLLTEVTMVLLWSNLETYAEDLLKSLFQSNSTARTTLNIILIILSFGIFLMVGLLSNVLTKAEELYAKVLLKFKPDQQQQSEQ